ncbi:hypothetical protein AGDE_15151 [Angomonas deanei]|uniref:Uncharacterized protein n=1 Tax=Angomonas deanei TaxID=59799 RepID=A0A7G2CQE4_9TRYP|nr:hypothetical protein AGDE_15151 [Angomonas deanei]CAD2220392.1 hypothetical protein, conserved [Angomonas deanei]|eukprot:EPY19610.1 hypothetical protein AGDE_15151 [Angomonas deanei]
MAPLPSPSMHGRTGSSAWYFNRFNANATQTHESSIRQQHLSSGSMYYNTINNPTASTTRQMAKLEPYFHSLLDRSKVFEGQSLDEIALVSAARENGFTLFQRTAKYMFVKFLDKMMCYEIIAECEFTPQRKLMSILLKRNEALDSRQAAEAAMAGTNVDYHRDESTEGSPSMNGKREEHSINKSDSYGSPSPPRDGLTQAASPKGSSVPIQNDIPPKEVSHSPFHTPTRADRENEKFGAHHHQRVLSLDSDNHSSNSHDSEWEDSPPLMHRAETEAFQKGENNGDESERSVSTKEGGNNHNGGKRKTSGGRESSMYSNVDAPTVDTKSIQVPQFLQRQKQEEEEKEKNGEKKKENPKPYLLLVKGADSSMLDIVDFHTIQQNVKQKDALLDELQKTASLGLRTLLLGERYLSEEEVRAWLPIYRDAQCCMNHRSERLHEAYALLERDINLIGSTAVEDKLQEGVPETLQFLSEASMVVWMLTGDKRETAVTIAKTCGLVDTNTENEALSASSSGHLPPVDPQATSQTSKKKNSLQNNNGIPSTICHIDLADLIAEEHAFVQSQQRKKQENEAARKK